MPPLLKPAECSLLVLDNAGEPSDLDNEVTAGRDRILRAASLCGVPAFRAASEQLLHAAPHSDAASNEPIYRPPMPGSPWANSPLAVALAKTSRTSLIICGYWLDEGITFTALNALAEGYDTYLLTDASPPLDVAQRHMAILRLVQAGIVPTTTRQALREWAADISDLHRRDELFALL